MNRRMLGKWAPAIVAGVVFAGVIGATLAAGGANDATGSPSGSTTSPAAQPVSTAVGSGSAATVPGFTTTTVAYEPIAADITFGTAGAEVTALQQRLKDLHFDPGPVDGIYGDRTRTAVWAFKKLILDLPAADMDGTVTPDQWVGMHGNIEVLPRNPNLSSTHVEVYVPEQVLVVFKDNRPELISHVSTGSGEIWTEEVTIDPGQPGNDTDQPIHKTLTGESKTPGGTYTFDRPRPWGPDGWRKGALGRMYKPVYFNFGIAVHGSGDVPNKPASHGCVRIPMHVAEYFPDLVKRGDDIWVYDGVHSPDFYGHQPPVFDRDITPTTTTSTTTSTTVADSTTSTAATTTTKPAPTTVTTTPTTTTTAAPVSVTTATTTSVAAAAGG